ncbi:MAG: endonuclease MutS2 [Flavobacteriaceae bacterium]
MSHISKKILIDLEFPSVIERIVAQAQTSLGKELAHKIKPFKGQFSAEQELFKTDEILKSFESENHIPSVFFEEVTKDVQMLQIDDSFLSIEAYIRLRSLSERGQEVLKFLKKFEIQFPHLASQAEKIEISGRVHEEIDQIINASLQVDDKASSELKSIRRGIQQVRGQIGVSFNSALSRYASSGVLDDIRESVLDHRRVLAVQAMHRKKVKGSVIGSSRTGSIVFISPESTLKLERELQDLHFQEKQEITKILKALNDRLRPYSLLISEYQEFLAYCDTLIAKAKYARVIDAVLPEFSKDKSLNYIQAYHPILLEKNKSLNEKTVPQDISLNKEQHIIVISGPNAGGKSITLKTIGLLQAMLQSGVLIPVDPRSTVHFFDHILTDIGDNQSIENQLSTYSYRLKNMKHFLNKCDDNTLFLIDEFGTGSDPELGGALAEIFLEEFYDKGAYGVITTHYSNLKVLAGELDYVTNASMLFNEKTLQPLYKLHVGQAGSSFTFEVAQKNGIPFRLINRAKKRVEIEKVRLDKTISKLQQERRKLQQTSDALKDETSKAKSTKESLSEKEQKVQEKLESFQSLYDENQKMLVFGRKTNELLHRYFQTNNKKELVTEFNKFALSEKTKHTKKNPPKLDPTKKEKKVEKVATKKAAEEKKVRLENIEKEVLEKVVEVRKKRKKEAAQVAKEKAAYIFKVGDRVRLIDSRSVGSIDKIEKNQVFINYGMFTTKAKKDQLELVEAVKKKS